MVKIMTFSEKNVNHPKPAERKNRRFFFPTGRPGPLPQRAGKIYTPSVDTSNGTGRGGKSEDIPWHPAFFNAIKMELEEYGDDLSFVFEHPLNAQPLRIDVVIVRKRRDVPIRKNIAAIFRGDNIIEYKSPDDRVSIRDFYKVYAYACLYAAIERGADITDMTLTFVGRHYPRGLLAHLREARGCTVEEKWPGVYIVSGDPLPIQIIDCGRLSGAENRWLRGLNNKLDARDWLDMLTGIARLGGKSGQLGSYLDALVRANKESLREAYEMSDDTATLDSVLEEIGLAAKWEARGEVRTETRILGLFRQGYTVEEVEKMLAQDRAGSAKGTAARA